MFQISLRHFRIVFNYVILFSDIFRHNRVSSLFLRVLGTIHVFQTLQSISRRSQASLDCIQQLRYLFRSFRIFLSDTLSEFFRYYMVFLDYLQTIFLDVSISRHSKFSTVLLVYFRCSLFTFLFRQNTLEALQFIIVHFKVFVAPSEFSKTLRNLFRLNPKT